MDIDGTDPRGSQGPRDPGDPGIRAASAAASADASGILTGWSEGARRLLGHPPDAAVGRPAVELLAAPVPEHLLRETDAGRGWRGRVRLRHLDGHVMDVELAVQPSLDGAGRTQGYLLSAEEAEAAGPKPLGDRLPDGRSLADLLLVDRAFAQSPVVFALYDAEGRFRRLNDASAALISATEDEVRGQRHEDVLRETGVGYLEFTRLLHQVAETGELSRQETFGRPPGVTRKHAWANWLWPVRAPDGVLQGVAIAAFDSSEQYWTEQRLTLLNEAATRIGTTLDMTRTTQELADLTVPGFADFISIDLLESLIQGEEPLTGSITGPVVLRRVAQRSADEGAPEATIRIGDVDVYPESSAPAKCLAAGESAVHGPEDADFARWSAIGPAMPGVVCEHDYHSLMTVPLLARGVTLGVAVFARDQHPEVFVKDDLQLAEELASRAALSVDNARRYTREHSTSLTLQRSLLPHRLPGQAAVEVASRYLPADTRAGVGGDWFDVIPLSGTRVALVVGDVVGHGIHASATMGRLRTAVQTLADVDLPPDELLTHLDDLVSHLSADEERRGGTGADNAVGTTCLYAVYDPASRRCSLSSAGHPPPAVVSPDGTVRFLDVPPGPLLGLGGLWPYETTEIDLDEGSLLVLYTDGLVKSRERDVGEGQEELRRALTAPDPSLEVTCDHVLKVLQPGRPSDDVALLVARTHVLEPDRVAVWEVPHDPAAVADARDDVTRQLGEWGLEDAAFITELVVSELVTNAIRHASPPVRLRLIRDERTLICEVSDASSTAPHLRRARVFDEGGRGLLLVAQLTQRWGTRQTAVGKTIWAEQALGPPLTAGSERR
jgi:serine phosphatase RsbU (regulator of sigma subunit)/PAS domain-containing protein/anti-sigma regulatory factor (Ser/Thr protein kinase)